MPDKEPPHIAVLLPGDSFSAHWVHQWSHFLAKLMNVSRVTLEFARSNNIYYVRNLLVKDTLRDTKDSSLDYVLWVDSDNLITFDKFMILQKALEENPDLAGVGAYYYVQSPADPSGVSIAAGWFDGDRHVTKTQIDDAIDPIEIDYIGLGFLLMRGSVFRALPKEPFTPVLDPAVGFHPDDSSFLITARKMGFRFAVHPDVYVPHLKLAELAPAPVSQEELALGR